MPEKIWISLRAQRAMAIASTIAGRKFEGSTDIVGDQVLISVDDEVFAWLVSNSGHVFDPSGTILRMLNFEEDEV